MPIAPVNAAQRAKQAQLLALEQGGGMRVPQSQASLAAQALQQYDGGGGQGGGGGLPGLAPRPRPMVPTPSGGMPGQFAALLGQQLGLGGDNGYRPPGPGAPFGGTTVPAPMIGNPGLGVATSHPLAGVTDGGGTLPPRTDGDIPFGGAPLPAPTMPPPGGGLSALGRMAGTPIGKRNRGRGPRAASAGSAAAEYGTEG